MMKKYTLAEILALKPDVSSFEELWGDQFKEAWGDRESLTVQAIVNLPGLYWWTVCWILQTVRFTGELTFPDGRKEWWVDGELHRIDGPAKVYSDGRQEWWVDGELHRIDGPAIISPTGWVEWWLAGKRHREDGPAKVYSDGWQEWWVDGKLHRTDGPAIICANGYQEWWVEGVFVKEEKRNDAKNTQQLI